MLKAITPQEEHRSRARRKLDAIEGFRGHATIDEDEEEDVVSVDSRTGLVQVFLVNVLILHNPIIIILIQGMVVNVLAPSDKVISSTTYTEGQVTSWRALRFIFFLQIHVFQCPMLLFVTMIGGVVSNNALF